MRLRILGLSSWPRRLGRQLALIGETLRLIWRASARWSVWWAVLLLALGLMPALTVLLTRVVTDQLVNVLDANAVERTQLLQTVGWAALLGATMLAQQLLQSLYGWVRAVQAELVQDYLHHLVHQRAVEVDLAFYESASYHDRLYQASRELTSRPLALLESLGGAAQNGIAVLALGALLLPYGLWLPILLALGMLPTFWAMSQNNVRHHRWWQTATADRRWLHYYETLLTVDSMAAEIRLFELGPYFMEGYRKLRKRIRDESLRLYKEQNVLRFFSGLGGVITAGGAMLWLFWKALQGLATLGDLVLFYQSLSRGQAALQGFAGSVTQVQRHTLYLQSLFEFLALQPQVVDPAEPVEPPARVREAIRICNITFRYPGSDRYVFENFSLTIPANKVVALVGFNGAGKSTLVKLLCRFYDPEAGHIEIDGIDIRSLRITDLRRLLSCMFQFPVPYAATAADNIAYGDLARRGAAADLQRAAQDAGAEEFVSRLPHGYDTLLGKLFEEGVQLSGGEWQRLALARAFFRQGQILILDEPTSLMDLWSEVDWFERFRRLAEGRTALLITHRFLTGRQADLIYVLDQGRIVEAGAHDELLARQGLYAQAWHDQLQGKSRPAPEEEHPLAFATHYASKGAG